MTDTKSPHTDRADKIVRSYFDTLAPRISYFLPRLHDDSSNKIDLTVDNKDEIPEVSSDED